MARREFSVEAGRRLRRCRSKDRDGKGQRRALLLYRQVQRSRLSAVAGRRRTAGHSLSRRTLASRRRRRSTLRPGNRPRRRRASSAPRTGGPHKDIWLTGESVRELVTKASRLHSGRGDQRAAPQCRGARSLVVSAANSVPSTSTLRADTRMARPSASVKDVTTPVVNAWSIQRLLRARAPMVRTMHRGGRTLREADGWSSGMSHLLMAIPRRSKIT